LCRSAWNRYDKPAPVPLNSSLAIEAAKPFTSSQSLDLLSNRLHRVRIGATDEDAASECFPSTKPRNAASQTNATSNAGQVPESTSALCPFRTRSKYRLQDAETRGLDRKSALKPCSRRAASYAAPQLAKTAPSCFNSPQHSRSRQKPRLQEQARLLLSRHCKRPDSTIKSE
jgi:hypothetical protein